MSSNNLFKKAFFFKKKVIFWVVQELSNTSEPVYLIIISLKITELNIENTEFYVKPKGGSLLKNLT